MACGEAAKWTQTRLQWCASDFEFQRYGVYDRIAGLCKELNGHQKVSVF